MAGKIPTHKIDEALADPTIPKLYANSFECALGLGDIALLLKNGEKATAVLNMSHTVAKTLAIRLSELVRFLESKAGTSVMTTAEVEKALRPKKVQSTTLQ
jgi:hypothetical protein